MTEFYFYGAGYLGQQALYEFKSYNQSDLSCVGFVDQHKTGFLDGNRIYKLNEISSDSMVVIAIVSPYITCEVYCLLREYGIKNIYWYKEYLHIYNSSENFLMSCFDCSEWGECVLPHGEIHVIDKCNLNCKGCMHFCPLYFDEHEKLTFEDCEKSLSYLMKKMSSVAHFSVLGGEPFLVDNLNEYLDMVRAYLPNTEITLTTNGLKVMNSSNAILNSIRKNRIILGISGYKPTNQIRSRLCDYLNNQKIAYQYQPVECWRRGLSVKENSKYLTKYCISEGCSHIRGNKIAKCPMLMYVNQVNSQFGISLPIEGIIDLDGEKMGKDILSELKERIPLCDYCIDYKEEWDVCDVNNLQLSDFLLDQ